MIAPGSKLMDRAIPAKATTGSGSLSKDQGFGDQYTVGAIGNLRRGGHQKHLHGMTGCLAQ